MVRTVVKAKPQTSVTGNQTGFTLLELMVVVALVGLISATVVVTLPSSRPESSALAALQQLKVQLQAVSLRATQEQRWFGIRFDEQRYRIMQFSAGQWQPNAAASATTLADTIFIQLTSATSEQQEAKAPQIQLSPDGLFTPFRLELSQDNQRFSLSDPYGAIE